MLKKILTVSALVASIAVVSIAAPVASASYYYDCSGNLQYGSPGPSECHYFIRPPQRTTAQQDRTNVLTPQQRTPSRDTVNVLTPQPRETVTRQPRETVTRQPRETVNVLTPQPRETATRQPRETARPSEPSTEIPQRTEERYEIRNARKYCIRNYCYYVYDYCDSLGNCVRKQKRYDNPDYNPYEEITSSRPATSTNDSSQDKERSHDHGNTWNYWVNQYINNYHYQYNPQYCGPYRNDCIYRGFYFGGFHNGYWYH